MGRDETLKFFKKQASKHPKKMFMISVILSAMIAWLPGLFLDPLKNLWGFGISILVSATVYAFVLWCITTEGVNKDFQGEYEFKLSRENIEFSRLTYLLNLLNSRIGAEYDDIAGRVGWLVTSQAFLVAGLIQVFNAEHMENSTR